MWNHVPFANSCHSSNWWDLFTRQTILSRYKAQSRQRKLVLFCWLDYLSLEDSCTEGILPERTRNHLFLGIYADSGWHLAAGQSVSVPLVTASVPPCSLQAPGTDPAGLPTPSPASRGLFISWQPQGPSYKHLSTRHATQLLFSHHISYGPISLAEWSTATPNLLTTVQQLICGTHTFSEYGSLACKG